MASDPVRDRDRQIRLLEEELKILNKVNKYQGQQIVQFGNLNKKLNNIDKSLTRGLGSVFSKQRTQYELSRQNPLSRSILESMLGSISDSESRQVRSLAFGRDLKNVMGGKNSQFQSGIGGYNEQLEAELQLRERGFKEIGKPMRDLAVRLRLTGQNEAKLIDVLRENYVVGGVTAEGLDRLSDSLTKAYKEYGVKADILVHSISNLGNNLELNVLGASEQVKGAIIDLTKQYGDGSEGFIKHFVELSTDVENFANIVQGGIYKQVQVLLDSTSTQDQASKALEEAMYLIGSKVQAQTDILQKQGMPQQHILQILKNIYGDLGVISVPLMNMEKLTAAQNSDIREANESFSAYFKEFPSIIQRYLTEAFGGTVTDQIAILKSTEVAVWTIAHIMMTTGFLKFGVNAVGAVKSAKELGVKGALARAIGLTTTTAAEGAAVNAGTAAVGGTAVRAGAAAVGGSLTPILLGSLAVLAAGAGIYYVLDKIDSKKVNNILKRQVEEKEERDLQKLSESSASINTPVGLKESSYDAITTAMNKRNNELLQQMLIELKRANTSNSTPNKIVIGGM